MQVSFSKFIELLDHYKGDVILSSNRHLLVPQTNTYRTSFKYMHDPKKQLVISNVIDSFKDNIYLYIPTSSNIYKQVKLRFVLMLYKFSNLMTVTTPMNQMSFYNESPMLTINDLHNKTKPMKDYFTAIETWIKEVCGQFDNLLFTMELHFDELT
jgi:hypothetical protein